MDDTETLAPKARVARAGRMEELAMTIRDYVAADAPPVYHLHKHAFDGLDEADLVRALHGDGAAVLSLVAEVGGALAGHILFSALALKPAPDPPRQIVALAPLAILPDFQQTGMGSALMGESLARLRESGTDGVIVLGHPEYYRRFGFTPASEFGIAFPGTVPEEAFMALPLREGGLADCAGTAVYHAAFGLA